MDFVLVDAMHTNDDERKGKHHYIPQTHLKYWADESGKIGVWRRVQSNGKLNFSKKDPSAVAYEIGLYALRGMPYSESQRVENSIFANLIEHHAGNVLRKLNTQGLHSLTSEEMEWWAVYLNSSLFRLPHMLEMLRERVRASVISVLADAQHEYEMCKGDATERTLLEWIEANCPERIENLDIEAMLRLLAKSEIIHRITQLFWIVFDLTDLDEALLLGDCPLLQSGSLSQPNALLAIPLSPTCLFLAVGSKEVVDHVTSLPEKELVRSTNVRSLLNSRKMVFGESDRDLVESHFPADVRR